MYSLMGFQKSGKTTLGQMLAQFLSWDWVDIDFLMEKKFKQPIQEIYAQLGEACFRNIETELIFQRQDQEKVVSLGGGVVMRQENIQHLKQFGPLIYLKISYETYLKRANSTPLFLQNLSLEQVFAYRTAMYEQYADLIIDMKNDSIEESFEKLLKACNVE